MEEARNAIPLPHEQTDEAIAEYEVQVASAELQASFAGQIGHFIEPVIAPLGYDWKIGIALITSFAAREVFVSTISTLYSIGGDPDDTLTIKEKLDQQKNAKTGEKTFRPAVGLSLLLFYAFAMQCMSTMAIVKRETNGWKWPMVQFAYMTGLAYIAAYIAFQVLS